ncbi:MAG: cobaltochelatase subunit CobN [Bacteroidetes bacterium]|nr:cobaltochelatase subunit CobN [Bacteroidota bacterium]
MKLLLISLERTRRPILDRAIARLTAELGTPHIDLRILIEADLLHSGLDGLQDAINDADVILTSHILNEDIADAILRSLAARSSNYHFFPFSSSGRLMRAMRIGAFSLGQISLEQPNTANEGRESIAGLRSLLQKLVDEDTLAERIKDLMSLAPKLLKFIPGSLRGLGYYLESYLAWLEPSEANTISLLTIILRVAETGLEKLPYEHPTIFPSEGIFDWRYGVVVQSIPASILQGQRPRVGLLVPRAAVTADDISYIVELSQLFDRAEIEPLCIFAETFDGRKTIREFLCDTNGRPIVDCIVSLTGFPLVGGHVSSEPQAATSLLSEIGVPYISAITLTHQRFDDWRQSREGLPPVQVATNIALTELDGAIEPIVVAATDGEKGRTLIAENAALLVRRVSKWIELRKKENRSKRLAIVLYCFPPARGAVGTAAYLDVFASLHALLTRLSSEGYDVELPADKTELLNDILGSSVEGNATMGASLHVAATLSTGEYKRLVPQWKLAAKEWGEPPGELNTIGESLVVFGKQYGNVFVGVQPGFGYEGDPMRLLFTKNATPHHGFLAFYAYINHLFGADAVVHFGTHGALEFMPGKHNGLSSDCWPQVLVDDLPNVYLYSVNNPSEAAIAKRRSYATTVSYLPPTNARAGLYKSLEELSGLINEYRIAAKNDTHRIDSIRSSIVEKANECHISVSNELPFHDTVDSIEDRLAEIRDRLIPLGLRIIGQTPVRAVQQDLLEELAKFERPELGIAALHDLVPTAPQIIEALLDDGRDAALTLGAANSTKGNRDEVATSIRFLSDVVDRLVESDEIRPLVAALSGQYTPPGPGGDLLRVPAALPVGRNITSLNPLAMPSPVAITLAATTVKQLLDRAIRDNDGRLPECIGLVLWGLDNIKTGGEAIAQAYHLLGVEPRPDALGNMTRLHVIPIEQLGRPRIDVVMTVSGIFRDMFAHHMGMLDAAVRLVATLDEPIDQNFVRKHTLELQSRGTDVEASAYRVFSNASGSYGTNVDYMVMSGNWNEQSDLASIFAKRKGYSFGKHRDEAAATAVLQSLASYIDMTYQNLDSSEIGISDVDHYYEYLGGLTNLAAVTRGSAPAAYVADTTTATPVVRSLPETVQLEARTKTLNPKWYEAMLAHGYEGVEEIKKRLDYNYGWSATANAVPSWFYDEVHDTFVADEQMQQRMRRANPDSFHAMTQRLFEAHDRGYWDASAERLQQLDDAANAVEHMIEGIANE